jgi:hypothetical protein
MLSCECAARKPLLGPSHEGPSLPTGEENKLRVLHNQLLKSTLSDLDRLHLVHLFAPFCSFTCAQVTPATSHMMVTASQRLPCGSIMMPPSHWW